MHKPTAEVWQTNELTTAYLDGVRGGIPLAQEQIDVMLRLLAASGIPVRRFLDLGCGDGILGAAILQRFPVAEGLLLDVSEPMLAAAREKLAAYEDRLQFALVDYGQPAWLEEVTSWPPFDAIVSGYSIHHQPDERKRALYAELYGMLRPGGVFVNIEHVASASSWGGERFDEYFIDALYEAQRRRGSDGTREEVARTFYHRPDKDANILALVEEQCGWLREIGFQDVDCYFKVFELAVFGGRRPAAEG